MAVLKDVMDADVYISLPKMKTHGLTMLSGSVKNNFGLLAGAQKSWYHYYSVKPEVFARIIIEMFRLRPPDLVIMDGILAMEGYGPASPETRWVNKVLASNDAVALDTVLAQMVGFRIQDVPYLQLARELRLGQTDLEAIEVLGEACTIQGYHRPTPPEASYSYRAGCRHRQDEHRLLPAKSGLQAGDLSGEVPAPTGMHCVPGCLPAQAHSPAGSYPRMQTFRVYPLQRLQRGL